MAVNEEILSALRYATERGQSLKGSMNALLNAGYNLAEVEEAAQELETMPSLEKQIMPAPQIPSEPPKTPLLKKLIPEKKSIPVTPEPKPSIPKQQFTKLPTPEFEAYQEKEEYQKPVRSVAPKPYDREVSSEKTLIIVLVAFLILLVGVLILLLVFRKQLINFFSSLSAS
ncbi:MAG: hypothetical protein M1416_00160 [Candidatus Pacearchaeota archaeon]|nr:hypothetical protein [Candidatus Pacearchaeota archaeon]